MSGSNSVTSFSVQYPMPGVQQVDDQAGVSYLRGSDNQSVTSSVQRVADATAELLVGREGSIPTHVELYVEPPQPSVSDYVVGRNMGSGRCVDLTLSPDARGASYQAFQALVNYLGTQLKNHDGSALTSDQVKLLRVRVNPHTQMARWTLAGTGQVTQIDLSQDEVAFAHISNMYSPIAREIHEEGRPLTRYVSGINGVAKGEHALEKLDLPGREPKSFFARYNPFSQSMPRDFSTYADEQLEKAMGDAAGSGGVITAMKGMATANLYQDRTIKFLEGQIAKKSRDIQQAKRAQVTPVVIQREERTLRQMEESLNRIRTADIYAVYVAIAHQDKVDAAATDMDKALALESAVALDLRDLVGLHEDRPWYNPAGLTRKNEGITADARRYAQWVGALAIEDRGTYYDYCDLQGMNSFNQMTVEQHYFRPEPGSERRDVAVKTLFGHIQDDQFQWGLTEMLDNTVIAAKQLHERMDIVHENKTGNAIKECVKLYEAAAKGGVFAPMVSTETNARVQAWMNDHEQPDLTIAPT